MTSYTSWRCRPMRAAVIAGTISLAGTQASAQTSIVGYSPDDAPSNAYSFDFEGCNLENEQGKTPVVYDPASGVWNCTYGATYPTGGSGDSYTDGNLGKAWEELDEVPHNIKSDSSGAAGTETYRIVIGGDNVIDLADPSRGTGYDRITVFGLNSTFSHPSCSLSVIGDNQTGDYGIGGADLQVVQVVELTQDADTQCLVETTFRLATGSSLISGSSNRGFVVAGTGDQSIPIPSDIQPQELSKRMSAVEDSLINWTIQKEADPIDWNFGNTCNDDVPNTRDVAIDITYTKGEAELGDLTATTYVTAKNPSSRTVRYLCGDEVFSGETLVDTQELLIELEPGMAMPMLEHLLEPGTRDISDVLSCDLQVQDLLSNEWETVGSIEAFASLPNDDITSGEVVNESIVIIDEEAITEGQAHYDFSAAQSGGVSGNFIDYIAGTFTDGPVVWQSDPQTDSGTVQFVKTVTVERGYDVDGTLSDTASIDLSDTTDVQATASTDFYTDPKIDLTINKELTLAVENDTVWRFVVKDPQGDVDATVSITVPAGSTVGSAVIPDLDPDRYTITELPADNWKSTNNPKVVELSLPSCEAEVSFVNEPNDNFFAEVEVKKITIPAGNEADWNFDLLGAEVAQATTVGPDFIAFGLDGGDNKGADSGNYLMLEQEQFGWDLTKTELSVAGCYDPTMNVPMAEVESCAFDIAYEANVGCTVQCAFTNVQRGTIIVEKQTLPDGSPQSFEFSGDAAGSLFDDGTIVVDNLEPGTYTSTELVPDTWDLTSISCDDGQSLTPSSGDLSTATATFELDPGETVKCTFTNVGRARGTVTKTVLGEPPEPGISFSFEIRKDADPSSSGVVVAEGTVDSTRSSQVDFNCVIGDLSVCRDVGGIARLVPAEYQFCEADVLPGWTSSVANLQGAFLLPSINGEFFVPNQNDPTVDNSVYCVPFSLRARSVENFTIDNTPPPGGDARTIGFWKNWTSCDGTGNQEPVLDDTLILAALGYVSLGEYQVDSCLEAVAVLDKRDVEGKKQASDPCFNAASQLLASELNELAGARTCPELVALQDVTHDALTAAGFDGNRCDLHKKRDADLDMLLNEGAGKLDSYNNNEGVCR